MSDEIAKLDDTTDLLEKVPDESVGKAMVTIADAFAKAVKTREISRARQEELERQLTALRAKGDEDRATMRQLSNLIEQQGDILNDAQRSEIVSTICQLALGQGPA